MSCWSHCLRYDHSKYAWWRGDVYKTWCFNSFLILHFLQIVVKNTYIHIHIHTHTHTHTHYSHYGYFGVTSKYVYLFSSAVFKLSFLGEFSKEMAANILVVSVRCVRLTVFYPRTDKIASHRSDFCDISYSGFLLKFVDIYQFWLKSDKINRILHENLL